ncbi:UvrD-helicase domain-containing protein (plasmid) [Deinococcus sp. KNUC1210]|uniref:UvrD-helicase domain-containing protein n=1 Tax=Deinococcus sp. KNUC1210 TaxID=2917691 RepID=UPI001EF03FDD|nr:UvrD-helicase domain-containing protein [Deinococcus sp. KNUC1210]ULH14021.1 UvrD-helicase domain-containing protein [Deinococcus sp. KNUC1210]
MTAQQQAISASGSVLVRAGAGTGKTYVIVERYVELLNRGLRPLEIVAVTYTERAALELRARIRTRVQQTHGHQPDLLAELEVAQISTIHALAARICRDHPAATGVPPGSSVWDEPDAQLRKGQWLEDAMLQVELDPFNALGYSRLRQMLEVLHREPYTAYQALERAGSSWEALIQDVRAEAWRDLQERPAWVAAVTVVSTDYGRDDDAIERSRRIAVQGLERIEAGEPLTGAGLLATIRLNGGKKAQWRDLESVKAALKTLRTLAGAPLLTMAYGVADEALRAELPLLSSAYRRTDDVLAQRKQRALALDYADLELYALNGLQQPDVAAYYARRWQHLMIDEAQDTSPVQAELLGLIGAHGDLTVVGDDQQAIYGFRGAGHNIFQEFEERILTAGGTVVTLQTGHRSRVALQERLNIGARAVLGETARPLTASRTDGEHWPTSLMGLIDASGNEAEVVVTTLIQLLKEGRPIKDAQTGQERSLRATDIAVLARRWSDLNGIRDLLTEQGVPWVMAGGGNLLETPEARDTWALLRFLADQDDSTALLALLRSPHFSISDPQIDRLRQDHTPGEAWWLTCGRSRDPIVQEAVQILEQVLREHMRLTPRRALQLTERLTGYRGALARWPDAERHLVDLTACHELVETLQAPLQDCNGTATRLTRLIQAEHAILRPPVRSSDAVTLSTIHGAKGLEWPVVALVRIDGAARAQPPALRLASEFGVAYQREGEETAGLYTLLKETGRQREEQEEARLVYVGMTRARDYLICSSSRPAAPAVQTLMQAGILPSTATAEDAPH